MRASAAMQDRVLNHEKVEVHFNTGVADAYGDKKGLKGLHLKDTSTGAPTFSRGSWCQMKCPEDCQSIAAGEIAACKSSQRCRSHAVVVRCEACAISKNVCTGEERKLEVRGLFYGIGHTPNSGLVEGQVELDAKGYVKASTLIPQAADSPS
jgi:thioredoxin reductase